MVPFGMVPLGLFHPLWCLLAWWLLVFPILCGAFWNGAFCHIIKVMDKERDKNIYIGYDNKMGIRCAKTHSYESLSHGSNSRKHEHIHLPISVLSRRLFAVHSK